MLAFADPVHASQGTFRVVMEALARPGTVGSIPAIVWAPPLHPAAAALALTLLDYETPVWLDQRLTSAPGVTDWFRFHSGAPITADAHQAMFAFVADAAQAPPLDAFSLGTMEYPDRSTTLVLQVESFTAGECFTLSGPGIAGTRSFTVEPVPSDFRAQLITNRERFPRGVDVIFVTEDAIAALPRSVRVVD
jgi:alpha-D-ribose 1-methylphosphonate 5-triphosphate synthase subunit PhnH